MSYHPGATGMASGLRGTGYRQVTLPAMSPEQSKLFSQLIGGTSSNLAPALGQLGNVAAGGDESMWKQLEAPAMRQFGALQGNIASRFSGMGSGARQSSGFQNTLGEAGAGLAEQLAAQRMGFQQQAIRDLLGLSQSLLSADTHHTFLTPQQKKRRWWQKLLGGGLSLGGGIGGALLGGPLGAQLGSQVGGGLGSAFLGE